MPSQNNEDEIIQRICERCDLKNGFFVEIGCDPHENNTSALEARGWHGVRYDKKGGAGIIKLDVLQDQAIQDISLVFGEHYGKPWLVSIDIDGNDYHVLKGLLFYVTPHVLVVEYNTHKYLSDYVMDFDADYVWHNDTKYGASLSAWCHLLSNHTIVDTNGVNAFFIHEDLIPSYYFKALP